MLIQLALHLATTRRIDHRQALLGVDVQIDDPVLAQGFDLGLVRHQKARTEERVVGPAAVQVMDVHAGAQLVDMDSSDSVFFHINYK